MVKSIEYLRGGNASDYIKNSRDQIRREFNNQLEVPRIQTNSLPNLPSKTHTAIYKGIKNTGYDERNTVQATREKLQTNKARNNEIRNVGFN